MNIINIRDRAEAKQAAARLLDRPDLASGDELMPLNGACLDEWNSPESAPGGVFASFYKIVGADGETRILAHAHIDLYGLRPEQQPWFHADRKKPNTVAYRKAMQDDHFFVVWDGSEIRWLEWGLNYARDMYDDVYRAQDYTSGLLNQFKEAVGVVPNESWS